MDEPNKQPEPDKTQYKVMIKIGINCEGKINIDTAIPKKDFVVNLLADAMKVAAMVRDNVVEVPKGVNLSPGGLRNWMNRKRGAGKGGR